MSVPGSTTQDLYDTFILNLLGSAPQLTDQLPGSVIDGLAGAFAIGGTEVQTNTNLNFNKTFIDTANGPEITGNDDDLQTLAVDHYGENFARPGAIPAIDTINFTRNNNSAGAITILAGTIVTTEPDANGNVQTYTTDADVIMTNTSAGTDTSVFVGITDVDGGVAGNAAENTITVIQTALLDSSIVCTNAGNATGADAQPDQTYRETIRNLIQALAGGTLASIEARALTVAGVVTATALETAITAIQYNIASSSVVGSPFSVVKAVLYVADATGTASAALLAAVGAAIKGTRSGGVNVQVAAATATDVSWTASYTLNSEGPNFTALSASNAILLTAMTNYINNLPVGTGFVRATANAAILALYGAAGTNDLTAFTTSVPSGDISASATTKCIAATIATV